MDYRSAKKTWIMDTFIMESGAIEAAQILYLPP